MLQESILQGFKGVGAFEVGNANPPQLQSKD